MAWEKQSDDRQWKTPEGDDPRTLYQMLMTSVGRFGDMDCFGYIPGEGMGRVHLDYNTFGELSTSIGKQLNSIGVSKGDRVALILNNSVEWAALSYGANAIGAVYTAMYTHQHPDEWAYILNDSAPSLIAIQNSATLDKLVKSMPADAASWPSAGVLLIGDEPANELPPEGVTVHTWAEFVSAGRSAGDFEIADDPFALNTLIYTSGTTGNPKGSTSQVSTCPDGLVMENGSVSGISSVNQSETIFTIWGNNSGGSDSVTFTLTVQEPEIPIVEQLPEQEPEVSINLFILSMIFFVPFVALIIVFKKHYELMY